MPDFPTLPGFNRLKSCRYGTMLYNINDWGVGQALDLYGEFSEGEVGLFRQMVRPGDIVFDVGANIGAHTVFFAGAVGPSGAVFSFEPQRILFQALCANAALNSFVSVYCLNAAAGAAPGTMAVPIFNPNLANNFGALGLGQYQTGDPVPIVTLDSFPIPSCRMLKIDVEGMELDVLKGAANLIERFRPILYVENDRPDKSADLIRHIHSLGYRLHWHTPFLYNPDNFLKNPNNIYSDLVSFNMLCVDPNMPVKLEGFPEVEIPA